MLCSIFVYIYLGLNLVAFIWLPKRYLIAGLASILLVGTAPQLLEGAIPSSRSAPLLFNFCLGAAEETLRCILAAVIIRKFNFDNTKYTVVLGALYGFLESLMVHGKIISFALSSPETLSCSNSFVVLVLLFGRSLIHLVLIYLGLLFLMRQQYHFFIFVVLSHGFINLYITSIQ